MNKNNIYIIGYDPYGELNWWQMLLKKTGWFYKKRTISRSGVFKWGEDGSVEFHEIIR